ncbi:CHAP domain-containing protein [Candidatus Saccharibacteria bacterium]|nr:CHAP domain-containing protein [Candidatus Saccharibacteria bacterium]
MKALNKNLLTILTATTVLTVSVFAYSSRAYALSSACKNSPACMEAVAKEQEANSKATEAQNTANEYQAKVNQLQVEIASMEANIAESEAYAKELQEKIDATQAKLTEQQSALAELLIQIHFDTKSDSITILAGSNSISDFAEKQSRSNTLKTQINVSAQEIKATKEKLEEDRAAVEKIIESQQAMKAALDTSKAEQQELVNKYAGDSQAYAAEAKAAREAQIAAQKAYIAEHPELYQSYNGPIYTGDNTYRWQADCPQRQDDYGTSIDGRSVGGYVCECVSYVGWKAYELYGLYLSWGNANTWDDVAYSKGIADHTPAPNTIGQNDGGYGHVFWVESVNSDGSILISEYNNAYSSVSGLWGDFGARIIPASMVGYYTYLHIDRL